MTVKTLKNLLSFGSGGKGEMTALIQAPGFSSPLTLLQRRDDRGNVFYELTLPGKTLGFSSFDALCAYEIADGEPFSLFFEKCALLNLTGGDGENRLNLFTK